MVYRKRDRALSTSLQEFFKSEYHPADKFGIFDRIHRLKILLTTDELLQRIRLRENQAALLLEQLASRQALSPLYK